MTEVVEPEVVAAPRPATRRRGGTFVALEIPLYRQLWLGSVLAFVAVQMQVIARGWLALELSGSNTGLGIVYLGFGIPMLLLSPVGGVVADRWSKRRVIMGCQLTLALSTAIVAVALTFDVLELWMLVLSAAIQAGAFSFLGPARMAFTGDLVGPRRLSNAIVLQQMSVNGSRVLGPALAGVLIGLSFSGAAGVYYLTTALLVGALFFTARLPAGRPDPDREVRSPLGEMADGVSYVARRPILWVLLLTSFVVVMIGFPYQAFLPSLAEEEFGLGSGGYGVMSGASAVGAVAASLLIASRADGPRAWVVQLGAGLAFGGGIVLLGVAPSYGLALVALVLVGAASSAYQSLNNAQVLGLAHPAYHGRVQSLMMLSFSGFGLVGLPLGALADATGLRTTFAGMGLVVLAAMGAYAVARARITRRDPASLAPLVVGDGLLDDLEAARDDSLR